MGTKRCRVNTVCRHELAVYWYYVVGGCVLFVNLEARKPDRYAAPCCARCASEIMRRALQHEEKEPGLIVGMTNNSAHKKGGQGYESIRDRDSKEIY